MKIIEENSRSLGEFLLLPGLTPRDCALSAVDISTDLVKFKENSKSRISIRIPLVSAIMQSVSGPELAIALAKEGGLSFIFQSQSIEQQARMITEVKRFRAGFVECTSFLSSDQTIADAKSIATKTGHSTLPVTTDGSAHGDFLGVLVESDYGLSSRFDEMLVKEAMTPAKDLVTSLPGLSLEQAHEIIWAKKLRVLPILRKNRQLDRLVFRKDYQNPEGLSRSNLDKEGRLRVGAGINTHDYKERLPELVAAGADIFCIDSSDGYSEWVKSALDDAKKMFGNNIRIGAGNIVDSEAFHYLVEAGADFIKVGVGPGSICITRKQKGIGRGQASALIDVSRARNDYFRKTGIYVPICSDGGIANDYELSIALALGADFIMMGRYFAGFDEGPGEQVTIRGQHYKEYWAEGSNKANNWTRYYTGSKKPDLSFEEGVEGYVPYKGKLGSGVQQTVAKIKSTFVNCGAFDSKQFRSKARLVTSSPASMVQSGHHSIIISDTGRDDR